MKTMLGLAFVLTVAQVVQAANIESGKDIGGKIVNVLSTGSPPRSGRVPVESGFGKEARQDSSRLQRQGFG